MASNETRMKRIEQTISPNQGHLMVMFAEWEPGEEPSPEKIEVHVSYFDGRVPETMTLSDYRKQFPNWENEDYIVVREDGEGNEGNEKTET